ncbi:hypothetical protein DPMN_001209 [Dreissena polymorpha]|uniref:Uncharacterized protein n=1 Tax=Dreissena polymorpha TaxID=45954 RepID=A0A9D4ML11_DREPO|nr:hypothetical protein DPMN_001209 [Dreissena polymorpha]
MDSQNVLIPPLGSHVFQANIIIFELIQDTIETNLLTKFHEDWTINVASRELTRKNASPPGGHFHEDWSINVASRVLTRFYYSHIRKNAPPLDSHVFQANVTIFKLIQDSIGTNFLTKFHEDRKINVASRVLTRKNALPPGGHVFRPTGIIFKLFQDIIGMNLLTKFHEYWTINVASRVKNAPPLGSHVFQAKVTIFELIQDLIGKNLLSKFHEDLKINVNSIEKCTAPCQPCFFNQPASFVQDIIGMNLLTKIHEDQTIIVASRVLTRFYYSHIRKNAPPLGSHVFQANVTIFELNRHIQKRHVLTKVHEDWTKNVTLRVFTCFHYIHIEKTDQPPGGHVFSPIWTIFELFRDINETNVSTKFHDDLAKIVTSRVFTRNTAPGGHVFQRTGTNFELNQHII